MVSFSPLSRVKWLVACVLPLVFFPTSGLWASAWTQKTGHGLFVQGSNYYYTRHFFDESGKKQSLAGYSKYELNPYVEYGVKDWLTLGGNVFLQRASQSGAAGAADHTNLGLSDSEWFARFRLWQKDGAVFSLAPLVKIPSPTSRTAQPKIGSDAMDTGLVFSSGYGFSTHGLNHFINLDTDYRHRFGSPKDQLNLAFSAGLSLTPQWMVLPQFFLTRRLATPAHSVFTQSSGDDYNLAKLQLSALYKLDDKRSVQMGVFSHVAGRNAGNGNGVVFALHRTF